MRAIEKLAGSADPQVTPLLLEALEDPDPHVRESAAAALGDVGDDRVVDPLVNVSLHETEMSVRQAALGALAKIDHQRATGTFLRALDDADLNIRQAAGWALRKISWQHLNASQKARVAIIRTAWEEVVTFGAAAVEPLEVAFRSGTHRTRTEAAEALGKIGTEEAISTLVAMLSDFTFDQSAREIVGRTLRRYCGSELSDSQQALICIALGEWTDVVTLGAAAVEALVAALPYPTLSHQAARALIHIGPAGVDSLVRVARDRHQHTLVREASAIALAEIGDARAAGPLLVMLGEPDMVIRQAAVWALQRLGWQPANDGQRALVAIANSQWELLRRMGAGAVEPLLALATESLATEETVAALECILETSGHEVSVNQLRTLAALPDSGAAVAASPGAEGGRPRHSANYNRLGKLARSELFRRGVMR